VTAAVADGGNNQYEMGPHGPVAPTVAHAPGERAGSKAGAWARKLSQPPFGSVAYSPSRTVCTHPAKRAAASAATNVAVRIEALMPTT
jgi:hypothetical protein